MKLLAIETATEACSVALWLDGEVRERFEVAPRGHARRVLPWAEALLAEAGLARSRLDAVAVGRGPGGFTGVRLAVAIGQGLALALEVPLIPVSSLRALAQDAGGSRVLAALDARRGEVYVGAFARDARARAQPLGEEICRAPAEVEVPEGPGWVGVGPGFAAAGGELRRRLGDRLSACDPAALPRAAAVAALAATEYESGRRPSPETVAPAYLREEVALNLDAQRAGRERAPQN